MMMFALLAGSVLCDVGGQICFKLGVHDDGRPSADSIAAFLRKSGALAVDCARRPHLHARIRVLVRCPHSCAAESGRAFRRIVVLRRRGREPADSARAHFRATLGGDDGRRGWRRDRLLADRLSCVPKVLALHDQAFRIPSSRRPLRRAADPRPDRHADGNAFRRQRAQPRRLHRARHAARRTLRRRSGSPGDGLARLVCQRRRCGRAPAVPGRSPFRRWSLDGRGARAETRDRPPARRRRSRSLRHDVLPRRLGDTADRPPRIPACRSEFGLASAARTWRWRIRRTASRTSASATASSARCSPATARPAASPASRGRRLRNSRAFAARAQPHRARARAVHARAFVRRRHREPSQRAHRRARRARPGRNGAARRQLSHGHRRPPARRADRAFRRFLPPHRRSEAVREPGAAIAAAID